MAIGKDKPIFSTSLWLAKNTSVWFYNLLLLNNKILISEYVDSVNIILDQNRLLLKGTFSRNVFEIIPLNYRLGSNKGTPIPF
jgi:hypothetical protein